MATLAVRLPSAGDCDSELALIDAPPQASGSRTWRSGSSRPRGLPPRSRRRGIWGRSSRALSRTPPSANQCVEDRGNRELVVSESSLDKLRIESASNCFRDAQHSCSLHEKLARIGHLHNTELVLLLCYRRVTPLLPDLFCEPPASAAPRRTGRLEPSDRVPRVPALTGSLQDTALAATLVQLLVAARADGQDLAAPGGGVAESVLQAVTSHL